MTGTRMNKLVYIEIIHHISVGGEYCAAGEWCIQCKTLDDSVFVGDNFNDSSAFGGELGCRVVGFRNGFDVDWFR